MGVAAFVILWLVAFGGNQLVYSTLTVLPVFIPIIASMPVAWLFYRISRVYPGSASVFGYAVSSLSAAALAIIALVTLSNGESWNDINIATLVLGLIYPIVAIGYPRGLEVFTEKLGLRDGDDAQLQHYDTIQARKRSAASNDIAASHKEEVAESDVIKAETTPPLTVVHKKTEPRDFSKAVKPAVDDNTGLPYLELDLDELALAERPPAHLKDPRLTKKQTKAPAKPRAPRKVAPKETATAVTKTTKAPAAEKATPKPKAAPRKKPSTTTKTANTKGKDISGTTE